MNVDDLYSERMDQSLSDTDTEPYSDHIDVVRQIKQNFSIFL